jgi:predicted O-methyltransferase YrrM
MTIAKNILLKLHKEDIYDGYEPKFKLDLHGGGFPEIFSELIADIQPLVIFEVGSWKGRSAIQMAKLLKQQERDSVLVCIDTWLGGVEHLPPEIMESWSIHRYRKNGYPKLYYQFLSNIVRSGVSDIIVPFPNTSNISAAWLKKHKIQADLIYVDASHNYHDVFDDLTNYYDLLNENGIVFGDDYAGFDGVRRAVNEFVNQRRLKLEVRQDQVWIIRKGFISKRKIKKYFQRNGLRLVTKDIIRKILNLLDLEIRRIPKV